MIIATVAVITLIVVLSRGGNGTSLSGDELQDKLRSELRPQFGSLVDTRTINCPTNASVGEGDRVRCSIDRLDGTVMELIVSGYEEEGTLRLIIDVDE